ncbi:YfhO family protein [Latilactobacillus sakei]|nr:YfhO family protein [Latilactobacillus sakei]
MFDKLKKNEFQVDSINKNRFDGHLTVRKNTQELITTIPYEPGWTVQVDGTNKKIKKVMGAFVGMELTPGEHKITFSYHVPLIRIGLVISIIGLCCLYGLAKINDIQKIKRNK